MKQHQYPLRMTEEKIKRLKEEADKLNISLNALINLKLNEEVQLIKS